MTKTGRFQELILQALKENEMETNKLYSWILNKEPSICDDSVRCVHNGKDYGIEWKHMVRSAQQILKNKGMVNKRGVLWSLGK